MNITRNIANISVAQLELSNSDIVSEENQNRLMYWRDVFRMGQFNIGDIAIEEVERNAMSGRQITQERIFRAVGSFCGKTERTVRYYYETSVYYPTEVRQEFNVLPFSHFVEARAFGARWREFLERSMVYPGRGADFIRNQMVAAQNSASVAADFSPDDNSDFAGEKDSDCKENSEIPNIPTDDDVHKKTCETSQGIPQRAINHDRLAVVNAVISRLPELEIIVADMDEPPEPFKSWILEAISTLRKQLPSVSRHLL